MRKLTNEEYTAIAGEGNYMLRVSLPYSHIINENNSNIVISTGELHYSLEGKTLPEMTGTKGDYISYGDVDIPKTVEETLLLYLANHTLPLNEDEKVEVEVKPCSIEDISKIKRFEIDSSGTLKYAISEDGTRVIIQVTATQGFSIHMGMLETVQEAEDGIITSIDDNYIYKGEHGIQIDSHLFTFGSLKRIRRNNYKGETR